jgi:hypothetical protein
MWFRTDEKGEKDSYNLPFRMPITPQDQARNNYIRSMGLPGSVTDGRLIGAERNDNGHGTSANLSESAVLLLTQPCLPRIPKRKVSLQGVFAKR